MKLDIKAFALACGILWGVGLFFLTWWIIFFMGEQADVSILKIYPGYNVSPVGSVIGLAWGFVNASIGGGVLAWLYNAFSK